MLETSHQDHFCANPEHQDQLIIGFCTQQNCQEDNKICDKCLIEIHQDHSNLVMKFEDIKNLSIKMKNSFEQFLRQTELTIKDVVKSLELIKENFAQQIHDCVVLQELIDAKQFSYVKEQVKVCKKLQNMDQSNIFQSLSQNSQKIKKLSVEINDLLIEIFRNKKKEDEFVEVDANQQLQYEDNEFYLEQIKLSQMLIQEAESLIQAKKYSEAVQKLKEAQLLDNQNHEIYFQRGKLLFILKDNYQALKDFDNTIKLNKKIGLAYNYKGQILNRLQRFQDSIKCFNEAQNFPECQNAQLFSEMAYAHYQLNNDEFALACCDKVILLDPHNSKAFNFKSIILMKMQRFDDANQNIDQAINLDPDNSDYLVNKGCLLYKMKKIDEALILFEKAQNINEENPRLYRKKIQLLKSLGKEDDVLQCYQQWIKYEPQNQNAKQQEIEYLKSIRRYQEAQQLEQGLAYQH